MAVNKKIIILVLLLCLIPCVLSAGAGTVRYDDPNVSKEVNSLRKFRDLHLKRHRAGRAFIKYYYRYGPIAAKAIETDEEDVRKGERLRSLIRLSLLPLMYAGRYFDGVLLFLKLFAVFLSAVFFWYVFLKFKKVRPENKQITILYDNSKHNA
jgi:hypothetical protein